MTLPVFKAAGTAATNTNWPTVSWPAGHAAGDFGILFCQWRSSSASVVPNNPTGFTLIGTVSSQVAVGIQAGWWYRFATSSSEPNVVMSGGTAAAEATAAILTWTGVNTGTPVHSYAPGNNGAGSTLYAPGLTTVLADCLIISVITWTNALASEVTGSSNSDLTSVTTRLDAGNTGGSGGGLGIAEGALASPSTIQQTAITVATGTGGFTPCATIALQSTDRALPTSRMMSRIINTRI